MHTNAYLIDDAMDTLRALQMSRFAVGNVVNSKTKMALVKKRESRQVNAIIFVLANRKTKMSLAK